MGREEKAKKAQYEWHETDKRLLHGSITLDTSMLTAMLENMHANVAAELQRAALREMFDCRTAGSAYDSPTAIGGLSREQAVACLDQAKAKLDAAYPPEPVPFRRAIAFSVEGMK